MPGTTRDSIDTVVETEGGPIRFIDTAGMRRKSRIDEGTEYFSMVRALKSVDGADVALLVIDASEGITHQDQRLAERIDAAGCPVVVLLNKWETLDAEKRGDVLYQLSQKLSFLGDSAVLKISALTGKGVHRLLPALEACGSCTRRRGRRTRRPSPSSRTRTSPPTISAISSGGCGRSSTWAPRRSRCGSVAGPTEAAHPPSSAVTAMESLSPDRHRR